MMEYKLQKAMLHISFTSISSLHQSTISYWLQQARILPTDKPTTSVNTTPQPLQITALNWQHSVFRQNYKQNPFTLI
jgi:hypothetical protein